jgi:hypothetical protein
MTYFSFAVVFEVVAAPVVGPDDLLPDCSGADSAAFFSLRLRVRAAFFAALDRRSASSSPSPVSSPADGAMSAIGTASSAASRSDFFRSASRASESFCERRTARRC